MAHGRTLFISDLHLHAGAPAAITQFERFIDAEGSRSDALYILGDLFETWIGDDDDDPARDRVCAALRALTQRGIPCRIQHGNRDFLIGAGFAARTGCELIVDPLVIERQGRRFTISHGDALCTQDVGYQRFRKVVRSAVVQRVWLALPLSTRRRLAAFARRRSGAHQQRMAEHIMDVTPEAVATLIRTTQADVVIHGHTHRPGIHALVVDGRYCTRIVLGDWYEQGSMLSLDAEGQYELCVLPSAA